MTVLLALAMGAIAVYALRTVVTTKDHVISTTINELLVTSRQITESAQRVAQIAEDTARSAHVAEETVVTTQESEAAGAGDAGCRFAIVAEIRKLADRVAGSAKEIRGLNEDVRGAVSTTIMATETGSKAVDAGSRQFDDIAASLKQIATLVTTTTEAAREIELSTKQQMTAVEQVNVAIANIAQASKETEASWGHTLQTASPLTSLSKDLLRLVKPQVAA
jgi:methyl-accepting chemotaxis protein